MAGPGQPELGPGHSSGAQRVIFADDAPPVSIGTVAIDRTTPGTTNTVAIISGQDGVAAGAGAVSALTPRITLASNDPAVATLGATTGVAVVTDANGTIQQYLRGLVKQWIAGTLLLGSQTNGDIGKVNWRHFNVLGSTLTRPANTTPYSISDSISNDATAGSVIAQTSNNLSNVNDDPINLFEILLDSTDTGPGTAGAVIRCHLFNSDPTAGSGVVGGDNSAWSNKKAGWFGSFSGVMRLFSDGSKGVLIPDEGTSRIAFPASGGESIWYQLQTLSAFTPSANSTTFAPRFKGLQGRL